MYSDIYSSYDPNRIDITQLYKYISLQSGSSPFSPNSVYPNNESYYIEGVYVSNDRVFNITDPKTELLFNKTIQIPFTSTYTRTTSQIISPYNQAFAVDLAYSTQADADNLELETVFKLKQFDQVKSIYIDEIDNIITMRVLIEIDQYEYDLMNEIFNKAEFPLKDKYEKNKLIHFQYIYGINNQPEPLEYFGKYLFHR